MGASVVSACGGATPTTAEPTKSPTEPAKEGEPTAVPASASGETLLQERCTACHSLEQVKQTHKSREEWERSVARMVSKGVEVNDDEQAVLVEYLVEIYGP